MKNNDKKNQTEDDKLHISEADKKAEKTSDEDELKKQEEIEKKLRERRKMAEEARDKRLEAERLELIRLKQGVIQESETIHEEHEEEIKLTFFQKIGNFFYHNKWWLGMGTVFAVLAIFLTVNLIQRPRPDLIVLLIGENYQLGEESEIENYISSFAEDCNGNGEILASVYYIPYTGNDTQDYANSVHTKLTTELQSAESVIVIGNEKAAELMDPSKLFTDLSAIYPDNEHIKNDRFMLSGTDFAKKVGVDEKLMTDDWFMAIRTPKKLIYSDLDDMQETYEKDFPVFDAMIRDLS